MVTMLVIIFLNSCNCDVFGMMKNILMTTNGWDKLQIIYLNSDMMVGSGQPRSSTSSTVEFWSENEKQRFT